MNIIPLLLYLFFIPLSVYASSLEGEKGLSPLRGQNALSSWRNQSCGEYYLKKTGLEADDVLSILKLLEVNPKFNSSEPNEIVNDDLYCLKAYFEYTPSNYTNKKLEVLSSQKQVVAKGNHALITSFRPTNGTLGKQFYLTLTIIDKQTSPCYEMNNRHIKILHRSVELNDSSLMEEIKSLPALSSDVTSPSKTPTRNKRSFSLSKLKSALTPKVEPPKSPKKEKSLSPDSSKFYSPILGRLRSPTSPSPIRTAKIIECTPAVKTSEHLTKSLSFINKSQNIKKDIKKNEENTLSAQQQLSSSKPWFSKKPFHRSKSYPELRNNSRFNENALISSPIMPRTVKERICEYEEKITKKPSPPVNIRLKKDSH